MRSPSEYLDMASEYDELARTAPESLRRAEYSRLAELYRSFGEAPAHMFKQQAALVRSADRA